MAVARTVPVHRLTLDDVFAMVEAGILDECDRVELEGGVLVQMMPIGPAHSALVQRLNYHFTPHAGKTFDVRVQDTFVIPDGGYYEPDLIVFAPIGDEMLRTALLVVEVAVSSRARDDEKAATYAAAGVTEYWIIDEGAAELVAHADPRPDGYATARRYGPGERVTPPVAAPPVDVAALLGRS